MIDFARLNHSTISFFNFLKPESFASKWHRIKSNAAKVIFIFKFYIYIYRIGLVFKFCFWNRKEQVCSNRRGY